MSVLRGGSHTVGYPLHQYSYNMQKVLIYSSYITSQKLQQKYSEQGNFYFLNKHV
jgi:hypothetical protein